MAITGTLGEYEKKQILEIEEWRMDRPSTISAALSFVKFPISLLIQAVVPRSAIRRVISGTSRAAEWLADEGDVMRKGKVSEIDELKTKNLRLSDNLANEVHNWALGIASAEGVGSGLLGFFGLALDIPFIITFALRTIYKIGLCYGYQSGDEKGERFALALLSVAGANTASEKANAVKMLRAIDVMIAKQTLKTIAEKAAQRQLAKEAALLGMENLGRRLGINITERKVLQAVPAIGAIVGGSVNAWFINDVAWTARRGFQERWLIENNRIAVNGQTV
jgi:hypothetical protein